MARPRISNEVRVHHTLIPRRVESKSSAWLHRSEGLCAASNPASTSYSCGRTSNSRENQETHQTAQALNHTITTMLSCSHSISPVFNSSEMYFQCSVSGKTCKFGFGSRELSISAFPSSSSYSGLFRIHNRPQSQISRINELCNEAH